MALVPLDYHSLTLSMLWSSASSVEIVIITFLPVSHYWTLDFYFLLTSTLSCVCSCNLKTLGACNWCVVGLYFSDF